MFGVKRLLFPLQPVLSIPPYKSSEDIHNEMDTVNQIMPRRLKKKMRERAAELQTLSKRPRQTLQPCQDVGGCKERERMSPSFS
jgi:hypothetical protein